MLKPELQVFSDTLVIEALLHDKFIKQAEDGFVSGLVSGIKSYVGSHIDENNKVGSILELLVPGVLATFSPWLAIIYTVADSLFGINLSSIFSSIKSGISSLISGGKQTDSGSVLNVVTGAFGSLMSLIGLESKSSLTIAEAQLFKVALENFVSHHPDFATVKPRIQIKHAASLFGIVKGKAVKVLYNVIKWIVTVLLASAGFMVAGDAIHGLVGAVMPGKSETKPDGTPTESKPGTSPTTSTESESITLQVSPSYSSENFNNGISSWTIPGNTNGVDPTFVSWAVEIYPQLKGYENLIRSTNSFRQLVSNVKAYNDGNNLGFIGIPEQYKSRKQLVDTFVSEIQQKLTEMAAKANK